MNVEGMRIAITGASAGIGAATAKLACERGARVLLSDLNDDAGEALAQELRDSGADASYIHCDISNEDDIQAMMAAASDRLGGLDTLHNNAGVHESMIGTEVTLEDMSRATFEKILAINLVGPFLAAKYAAPLLAESEKASIINAGSTGSMLGYPNCLAYGASKGGIATLTKDLAVELAPKGIRVNCYCPASTQSKMVDDFLAAVPDPTALKNMMASSHLVPRIGQPVDVAELVLFLASPAASFVNGVVWLIDGGSLSWRGSIDMLGMEVQN